MRILGNIMSLLGLIFIIGLFFVWLHIEFGNKTEVQAAPSIQLIFPKAEYINSCFQFCKENAPKNFNFSGRVKLEQTYGGTVWACECNFQ